MKNRALQMGRTIQGVLIVLLINTISITNCVAQSTMGTDFWVTFLPAYLSPQYEHQLSLIASGPRACTCNVTNPNTNWSQTFTIIPNNTTIVDVPYEQAFADTSDCIINKGLHVISSDTISLYASNYQEHSFDVTDVLPTYSLGSEYVIQTYPPYQFSSEFSILATENDTQVNIVLSCNSSQGHYANQSFSITLNAGQCYQVKSIENGDLSGSQISVTNDKKVAVFAGDYCTFVSNLNSLGAADHIWEQMMPITCWGQHFVITSSMLRPNDRIRVTALNDNCQIMKNGTLMTTINARQTYQFQVLSSEPSSYLETSEPTSVFLYLTGTDYPDYTMGDPSMVIINPIEQRINNVTFCTFNSGASQFHYVNVVTDADKVSGMRLDGNNIASQFQTVSGNANYAFARIQLDHGAHTLNNQNGGFVAHVYGLGESESYAYSVGSMAINLTSQMLVNGQVTSGFPNGIDVCVNDPLSFDLNLNFSFSQANWTFGDGGTGSGSPVSHSYDNPGEYTVSCDVYKTENGQNVLAATLTTELHVHGSYQEEIDVAICDSYTWMGQTYTQSGNYLYQGQTTHGCDSIVTLHLTINYSDTTFLNITACDEYEWYGQTFSQPGVYTHMEQTIAGCDSLLVLNLDISDSYSSEESITSCNSYYWRGNTYTESGTYTDLVQTPGACDSTFVLHLTLGYDVQSDTTTIACNAFAWHGSTYTETGDYYYMSQTALGCDSTVVLHLTINPSDTTYLNITACDEYEWYGQTFSQPGVYTHTEQTIAGCDSLLVLNLDISGSYISEESITSCNSYYWRGNTYTESGTYTDFVQTPGACDSTFVLNLNLGHDVQNDTTAVLCNEFTWYGITYSETGDYTHLFQTPIGCDSILSLHLTIGHEQVHSAEAEETCEDSFPWHGHIYSYNGIYYDTITDAAGCDEIFMLDLTFAEGHSISMNETVCDRYPWAGGYLTESGHYTYEGQTQNGCDSIIELDLTVDYVPSPTEISPMDTTNTAPHWVITATEFQIKTYDFQVWDTNPNCNWDTVTWSFERPMLWKLEPFGEKGKRCKMYVLNYVNDTVWLITRVFNRCASEGIEQRYWFVCSFYSLEETGSEAIGFNVIPNPNDGQMKLVFDHLTGKVGIKVYDMTGSLIDDFQTYNGFDTNELEYSLEGRAKGIYFFVATGKEGTVAKKVIIR